MTDNNQSSPSQRVQMPTAFKNKVTYVSPGGVVDHEGFLSPPPPSTLSTLYKGKKTNSSTSSPFFISSPVGTSSEPEPEYICHVCKMEYNGSHFCKICSKRVHAFCGVSNEDDEGYGGQVTCHNCNKGTGSGICSIEADSNGYQDEGLSVSESLRHPGEAASHLMCASEIDKHNESIQTQKPSEAEVKLTMSKIERSADEILISDIMKQGSSSGCSGSQAVTAIGTVAHDKEDKAPTPIPKLILSKMKSWNIKGKKRGRPRGTYKKRLQANTVQSTGKRRYTSKKAAKPKTASVDPEIDTENVDLETGYESEDSGCSVTMTGFDSGIWNPMDDLRLIYNMTQLQNLEHVHIGVRFSCNFTLEEVTARWKRLFLADEKASSVVKGALKSIHPMLKDRIRKEVCFSTKEDDLIKQVPEPTIGNPGVTVFQNLLDQNIEVFFKYRTARIIRKHWILLRELNFLDCQKGLDLPDSGMLEQWKLENDKMSDKVELPVVQAILYENRALLRKMKKLHIEIKNLTAINDSVILKGSNVELKMKNLNNLATLKGQKVQFLMKSKDVTFGRKTEHNNQVDMDLQLEGNSNKISRLQGKITFDSDGQFRIHNAGRHSIFIDGKPLHPQYVTLLQDESLIMIGNLSFVFSVNHYYHEHLKEQENKKCGGEQAGPKSAETSPSPRETVNKKSSEMPGSSKDAV